MSEAEQYEQDQCDSAKSQELWENLKKDYSNDEHK